MYTWQAKKGHLQNVSLRLTIPLYQISNRTIKTERRMTSFASNSDSGPRFMIYWTPFSQLTTHFPVFAKIQLQFKSANEHLGDFRFQV